MDDLSKCHERLWLSCLLDDCVMKGHMPTKGHNNMQVNYILNRYVPSQQTKLTFCLCLPCHPHFTKVHNTHTIKHLCVQKSPQNISDTKAQKPACSNQPKEARMKSKYHLMNHTTQHQCRYYKTMPNCLIMSCTDIL